MDPVTESLSGSIPGSSTPSTEPGSINDALSQVRSAPTQTARTANLKKALEIHRDTTPDDGRVKLDPVTNLFKGEHFRGDDPMHQEALSSVPEDHKYKLALAQEAIQNKQPMHLTHKAAKSSPAVVTSRESRTQEYKQEQPGKRQEEHQESGHTIMPTAIGVTFGKKPNEPNRGYIQGLSSSVAASNAHHLNNALGKDSPYPDITHPKFHQDLAGYVGNLNNGYTGDGHQPAKSTTDVQNKVTEGYEPHLLEEKEANYLNAVLHNVAAKGKGESARIARELAQAHGKEIGPEGEANPLRKQLDEQKAKRSWYPGMPEEQTKPWSEEMLEPVIRHFNAEHIQLHDRPEDMAETIRPPEGVQQIHQAFAQHGVPKKEMVAAHVLSGPVGKEEPKPEPKPPEKITPPAGGPPGPGEFGEKEPPPPKSRTMAAGTKMPSAVKVVGPEDMYRPEEEVSEATRRVLGPRPKKDKKAMIAWDKFAERLDSQVQHPAIPLIPARDEKGKLKYKVNEKGVIEPQYKLHPTYDLANAPLLQNEGKALGKVTNSRGGLSMAEAPKGTEDKLEEGDLDYLNKPDRLRVSHLNELSAVDTYSDKLVKYFNSIKDKPEVMAGKDWYDEAEGLMRPMFGKHLNLFANLLAATSAGTNVKANWQMAVEAYHQFLAGKYDKAIQLYRDAFDIWDKGGRVSKKPGALAKHLHEQGITEELSPTEENAFARWIAHHGITPLQSNGNKFGHNSIAVLKVLAHAWEEMVEGPKTLNFAKNLSGRSLDATIDMWAARTMRRLGFEGHTDEPWLLQPAAEPGVSNVDFALSQLAFRKAAAQVGLTPKSLQAVLWFAEQKHYQANEWEREIDPNDRDYRPMLREYQQKGPPKGLTIGQKEGFDPTEVYKKAA